MASLQPRPPYSEEELKKLYPKELQLQLVQIFMRHGERTPESPRFQNAGVHPNWPYCTAARRMISTVMLPGDHGLEWNDFKWRRRLEGMGEHDNRPVILRGPKGKVDGICQPGELTDQGHNSTYALGARLRHLYIDQLHFMPALIDSPDSIYLRSTYVPRAQQSMQQAFVGFYPPSTRTEHFPLPTIISRAAEFEHMLPTASNCERYGELFAAFTKRTAERWNDSPEMGYISRRIGKWMPKGNDGKVKVDSDPTLVGVMDTVNSTLSHPEQTRLPKEFYEDTVRNSIMDISVEQWFSGYGESREYRTLGIGGLAGDIVARMVGNAENNGLRGTVQNGSGGGQERGKGQGWVGEERIKFGISGCHDTTLASLLSALGAFKGESWPPFTSHVAIEMFKRTGTIQHQQGTAHKSQAVGAKPNLWNRFFGLSSLSSSGEGDDAINRKPLSELTDAQKESLEDHYVRIRYNDKVMKIPGCASAGKHLEGDDSFCTLKAFKEIVDDFTPKNWRTACKQNLGKSAFAKRIEKAGYAGLD